MRSSIARYVRSLMALHIRDFIEIDVEVFEEDVLIAGEQLLRRFMPVICFEFSPTLAAERSR